MSHNAPQLLVLRTDISPDNPSGHFTLRRVPLSSRKMPPVPLKIQLENYMHKYMHAHKHTYIHAYIKRAYILAHIHTCIFVYANI